MKISRPYKNVIPSEPALISEISEPKLGFSPMLNSMLSLVIKDGFANKTTFNLLNDIYPFVSGQDRNTIKYLLSAKDIGDELVDKPKKIYDFHDIGLRPPLSETNKMFNLLNVFKKYSGMRGGSAFTSIERIMKLKHKMNKTHDQFDIMSEFIPEEQRNMVNIMKTMGRMKNGGSPMDNFSDILGMMPNQVPPKDEKQPDGAPDMASQLAKMMGIMNMMNGKGGGMGDMSSIMNMMNMFKGNS